MSLIVGTEGKCVNCMFNMPTMSDLLLGVSLHDPCVILSNKLQQKSRHFIRASIHWDSTQLA